MGIEYRLSFAAPDTEAVVSVFKNLPGLHGVSKRVTDSSSALPGTILYKPLLRLSQVALTSVTIAVGG